MPQTVIASRKGPIRMRLEANREWLELFSARERNALLRGVFTRVGNEWRHKFLRRRLEARTVLKAPFSYTLDTTSPMIESGYMARAAIWKGKIRATAKRNKQGTQQVSTQIALPFGHPVRPEIAAVFRIIPNDEVRWFADRVAKLLAEERAKSVDATARRKNARPRLRLSNRQRRRFGVRQQRRARR